MSTTTASAATATLPLRREPLRLATWATPAPTAPPGSARSPAAAAPRTQPIAAVRLPTWGIEEVRSALACAGFSVLDILSQDIGPVPTVLILELPEDDEALTRLLAHARPGVGRVLITSDRQRLVGQTLRPGVDEIVDFPCHPLQVTVAALRVSGTTEYRLACWSENVFDDLACS